MTEIILYIAVSKDGFIADKKGGIAWLEKYNSGKEDYGYNDFYHSIDALVMGKNTYNQLLTFGRWPFAKKKSYVFADKDTQTTNRDIEIVTTDVATFMKKIERFGTKRLWLMGGAQIIESFYKLNLIDEYIIAVMPEKLGEGIALPKQIFQAKDLKLVDTIKYPQSGIVQTYYVPYDKVEKPKKNDY